MNRQKDSKGFAIEMWFCIKESIILLSFKLIELISYSY
jgi:hypothetical protein